MLWKVSQPMLSYTHAVLSHEFVIAKEKRLKYSHERYIIQGDACRYPASASPTSSQFPFNDQKPAPYYADGSRRDYARYW